MTWCSVEQESTDLKKIKTETKQPKQTKKQPTTTTTTTTKKKQQKNPHKTKPNQNKTAIKTHYKKTNYTFSVYKNVSFRRIIYWIGTKYQNTMSFSALTLRSCRTPSALSEMHGLTECMRLFLTYTLDRELGHLKHLLATYPVSPSAPRQKCVFVMAVRPESSVTKWWW